MRAPRRFELSSKRLELLESMLRAEGVDRAQTRTVKPRQDPRAPVPLTFPQRRLWFLEQFASGNSAYVIPAALRVRGPLDVEVFERACGEVVRRHEALRTVFSAVEGLPQQRVRDDLEADLRVIELQGPPAEIELEVQRRAEALFKKSFDLSAGPLLRIEILRFAEDESVVLFGMHHIVSDQWSLGVLLRELVSLYASIASARPSDLPELTVQYPDFALWQQETLPHDAWQRDLEYWTRQLGGASAELGLPLCRPRPKERSSRGASLPFDMPPALVTELRALARKEGTTLFMVLAAAFKVLLFRLSGNEDVLIGTPVANRTLAEIEPLIGFFVNTLVLRTDLSGDPRFRELLQRVAKVCLDAYEHQDLPFERLVEELQPERSLARTPLFQVAFVFQNTPFPTWNAGAIRVEPMPVESGTAKFDLELQLFEDGEAILGHLEYSLDVFDERTARRMLEYLDRLLRGAAADPDEPISTLPLLGEAEQRALLAQGSDSRREWPANDWVQRRFERQASTTPEAEALRFEDQRLSYRNLDQRANRLAHRLRKLGVGKDVLVGICMERSVDMVAGLLAVLKAGGAYVPLDPAYPRARIDLMLEDSRVPVLLTQRAVLGRFSDVGAQVLCVDEIAHELESEPSDPPEVEVGGEDLAYVIYTSGSTGKPKGVQLSHRALANFLRSMEERPGIAAGDALLAVTSLSFDIAGLELMLPLVAGARIVLVSRDVAVDGPRLAEALARSGATILQATPSTWRLLLGAGWSGTPGLRMLCGGEALPRDLADQLLGKGESLWNMYGPTETTIWSAVDQVGPGEISIGAPIANTELHVLDKRRQLVPVGVSGELYIGGTGLARGYLGRPDLTAERFVPQPFETGLGERLYRTGDLVRRRPDGRIEFLGRIDHQVKVRGFRIELGEIEAALTGHPQVGVAIVTAREHAAGDTRLVAYLTGDEEPKGGDLIAFLKERLPEYMVPSTYVWLRSFPLTPNGKVDRGALPEPEFVRPELETAYVAPRDGFEAAIAQAWSGLLGIERPGVHDSFFELGGHSLLATQVASRLKTALGVELPLRELFERPTIAALAAWMKERGAVEPLEGALLGAGAGDVPRTIQRRPDPTAPAPLTFSQRRLWFLEQLAPGSSAYVIPAALRVRGKLDFALFQRACDDVVRRHESLRTVFCAVEGRPQQVVREDLEADVQLVDLQGTAPELVELEVQRRGERLFKRPFDLVAGPLLRIGVLRLGADEAVVLVGMHHIVSDQWSLAVLLREIVSVYAALAAGRAAELPELPIQYPDFALWQQEARSEAALKDDLDFWVKQLRGASEELGLPLSRPRPREKSYRGAAQQITLPPALVVELRALARKEGTTLFMVLAAAFKVLLYRLSGNEDVVIGTPVAGRTVPEVEPLVGFFVNTVVLRTDLSGDPSFRGLVKRVSKVFLDAYDHQGLPFERLVEELQPARSLARTPLFQVAFSFQNVPFPAWSEGSIRFEPMRVEAGTAKFDLELQLFEDGDTIWGHLEYSLDVFDESAARRMVGQLERLLRGVAADPEQAIARLPLLTDDEQRQLVAWNQGPRADEAGRGAAVQVHERIAAQAARTPGRRALVDGDRSLTYAELDRAANRLARHLQAAGVGPDSVIGVCLERSAELVVALLATLKAGGAYLPLDPGYPAPRLAAILDRARITALVTAEPLRSRILSGTAPVILVDRDAHAIAALSSDPVADPAGAADLAYVIATSGSTGTPKPAAVHRGGLANLVRWFVDEFEISERDRSLVVTSPSFDLTQKSFFAALTVGGEVQLAPHGPYDPAALAALMAREGITLLNTTPSAFKPLLEHLPSLSSLRGLFLGGEPIAGAVLCPLVEVAEGRLEVVNTYGPTECSDIAAFHRLRYPADFGDAPVPIGRPITGARLHVLDRGLQHVPVGVTGELYIGGDGVGRGYLGDAALTAARWISDPFSSSPGARLYRTGDLVRRLPDGNVDFLGRSDHQVKLRGFRIELGEIEQVLAAHPQVKAVLVTARQHPAGDTRLVAYVCGDDLPNAGDLAAFVAERLPDYMVPSAFVSMTAFPLTPNGKVDRAALPEPDFVRPELEAAYVAPRDALERAVAEVWSELLGVERVGIHDDFFELGGHSLLATQVSSRLRAALGFDLPLRELFERPTIARLAAWMSEHGALGARSAAPIPVADRAQDLPLSFAQEWLCVHHPKAAEDPFHNVVTGVRICGRLDEAALEKGLNGVVRRHDALRTRIVRQASGLVQVVDADGVWPLRRVDLRALDAGVPPRELRRLIDEESRRSFRLAEGPLVRGQLVRLAEEESVLLLVMHHAVTDNWSFGVLVRELTQLYAAHASGGEPALPALAVQYPDFAAWQRQQLASGALDEGLQFWRARLKDLPPAPRFEAPAVREEEAVTGAVHPFVLDRTVSAALLALARREGVTPFMVLLAAYDVLLSAFSGSEDVSVSFPNAGRHRRETEELIGYFVNTLVVRTDLSGSPTFRELVARVRESTLAATAHEEVPPRLLGGEPGAGRDPFRIAFNLLNAPLPPLELPGLKLEPLDFESGYVFSHVLPGLEPAEVDLALVMREDGGELRGMWLRAAERVEARVMGQMMHRWSTLLEIVTAHPDEKVEELRRRLLQDAAANIAGSQPGGLPNAGGR